MCLLPIEAQTRAFPKHIGLSEWPYGSVPDRPLINEWLWGLQLIRLMLGRCWRNLSRWSILQFAFWGGLVGQPWQRTRPHRPQHISSEEKLRSFHNEKNKKKNTENILFKMPWKRVYTCTKKGFRYGVKCDCTIWTEICILKAFVLASSSI